MKSFVRLLSSLVCSGVLFLPVPAQDIAGEKLGRGFTYSSQRSASHGDLSRKATRYLFQEMEDLEVAVAVYESSESFEEAVRQIPVPQDSDVSEITEQYPSGGLGFFLALFENQPDVELDSEWLEKARSTSVSWGDAIYRTFKVTQGEGALKGDEELMPGQEVEIFSLECQSPLVDYGNSSSSREYGSSRRGPGLPYPRTSTAKWMIPTLTGMMKSPMSPLS